MKRRVLAAAAAAATALAILPATPAFASAAASAALDAADAEILPGAPNEFDVTVTNGEAGGLTGGRSINTVRVVLPSNIGLTTVADQAPPAEGWTVTRVSSNGLEAYVFKTTGAGIQSAALGRAAGSLKFPIKAAVARPSLGDRAGALQVSVSSDGGSTFQTATGDLGTTIRTLQVLSVVPGGGALVADGDGTAGQDVPFLVSVKNHAMNSQTVTAKLTSNAGTGDADTIKDPAAQAVGGGATGTFSVPVTLGKVSGDLTRRFTATATSTRPSSSGKFTAFNDYVIQVAPRLNLVASTFAPTDVRNGISYVYKVDAAKSGTPTLSLTGGTLTLRDPATNVTAGSVSVDPATFAKGAGSGPVTSGELTIADTVPDGQYDAVYALTGVDGNGFVLDGFVDNATLVDRLNLDNLGPVVNAVLTLPNDRDGDRTTAVRDYVQADANELVLDGTVNDVRATPTAVALQCQTGAGTVLTPDVGPTLTTSGSNLTFRAVFRKSFPTDCLRVTPVATFKDPAGNTGSAKDLPSFVVDNVAPTVEKAQLFGAVVNIAEVDPAKPSVEVNIDDAGQLGVIGGCDPRNYTVDGQLMVQAVYVLENGTYRNCTIGTSAQPGTAKPVNNARYLRVSQEIMRGGEAAQPVITYDPARTTSINGVRTTDRIKDAAGHYAARGLQDTITRLVPDAPTLVAVTRNKGAETAVQDGGAFYTRFAGKDLVVSVAGGVAGDTLEIYPRGATSGPVGSGATTDGEGEAGVPVAATENVVQGFDLRFRSASGVLGLPTPLDVVYDVTAPKALSTAKTGASQVSVTFAEPVLGDNFAINWSVFENVEGEQPGTTERAFRGVNSVTGAGAARTLSADLTSAPYGGAQYLFLDGKLYEDRAGNPLAQSVLVTATG